jgi:hypothetical protein
MQRQGCAKNPEKRTFGKRRRAEPEFIDGIRDRDVKEQLHLGCDRISDRICRKVVVLEI